MKRSITYRNLGYSNGYSTGYTEGYSDGQNNSGEILYTYHIHGDGYCTSIPVYHSHTAQSGSCYVANTCGGTCRLNSDGTCCYCSKCGDSSSYKNDGKKCGLITSYSLVCGKNSSTIEKYVCNVSEGTILSATIVFN